MNTDRTRKRIERIARKIAAAGDTAIDFGLFQRILSSFGYVIQRSELVNMNGKRAIRHYIVPEAGEDSKPTFMAMAKDVKDKSRIPDWITPTYLSVSSLPDGEPRGYITILD